MLAVPVQLGTIAADQLLMGMPTAGHQHSASVFADEHAVTCRCLWTRALRILSATPPC